jgi:hypothetical protein
MLAVGLAIMAIILGQMAEREARLAQYDVKILQNKLAAEGIETTDEHN